MRVESGLNAKVAIFATFCYFSAFSYAKLVQRGITQNIYIQELWFLRSARWPMLVNIYIKFHDNTLNGLQTKKL